VHHELVGKLRKDMQPVTDGRKRPASDAVPRGCWQASGRRKRQLNLISICGLPPRNRFEISRGMAHAEIDFTKNLNENKRARNEALRVGSGYWQRHISCAV
jgi:hypothetical protein